ncbi:hypothetical protein E4U41_001521, partial [Claviceps citrina]
MTTDDDARLLLSLPRILCLHGGGVNARVFRLQCRTIVNQLEGTFRLVFVDGPYACEPHEDIVAVYGELGPFYRWLAGGNVDDEDESGSSGGSSIMQACLAGMEGDAGSGPWVGVLGFSQGAKIAVSLLWAQQQAELLLGAGQARTGFRFGVLLAGSAPVVHLDGRLPRSR